MARNFPDWLTAYVEYASVTEAPKKMHFWSGVSAIAGALRRKVWVDMRRYRWYANFYIVFVAKPGIVAKSTTSEIAMDLLRQVPGVKFGPDIITWPALASAFAAAGEMFEYQGEFLPMSAITLQASELGNLIDPTDRQMVNLYIDLWDGRRGLEKVTKMAGCDMVDSPWINIIGCTTPNWIIDNMPKATIGGGFTSRCIFVYADKKERYIAFVDEMVGKEDHERRLALVQDLEHIALNITGPFVIPEDAREWERKRYQTFWEDAASRMDSAMVEGYAGRKQTHLIKTAMILSASERDNRVITLENLQLADLMLQALEPDMAKVFAGIGQGEESVQADKLIAIVAKHGEGGMKFEDAYRTVHAHFPKAKDFEDVLAGAIRAGYLKMVSNGTGFVVKYVGGAVQ